MVPGSPRLDRLRAVSLRGNSVTKRDRQLADYRREVYAVEFLGGPLDGEVRIVSKAAGILHIRSGCFLHVYERGEQHIGYAVREVFRHVNVVESA